MRFSDNSDFVKGNKTVSKSALQDWVFEIPMMQQSVLMSGIRGMDGLAKRHPAKSLIKFYRRCLLISSFEKRAILTPYNNNGESGGDFTGPSINLHPAGTLFGMDAGEDYNVKDEHLTAINKAGEAFYTSPENWPIAMQPVVDNFIRSRDEMTLHYYTHMMHAFQIMGYKHPDLVIRKFWREIYDRMCNALHLFPEDEYYMDKRLGDDEIQWRARSDEADSCST